LTVKIAARIIPLALVAAVTLSACGGKTGSQNADEFRSRVNAAGHAVVFEPERTGRPDLVVGKFITEDGEPVDFSFSFGPAPSRDLPAPADTTESVWFDAGDEVHFWVQPRFVRDRKKLNRYYEALFAIEDTACQVVAERDCEIDPATNPS
jgi:hypothetical protein